MVVRVRAGMEPRMAMSRADLHPFPRVCWALKSVLPVGTRPLGPFTAVCYVGGNSSWSRRYGKIGNCALCAPQPCVLLLALWAINSWGPTTTGGRTTTKHGEGEGGREVQASGASTQTGKSEGGRAHRANGFWPYTC